MGFMDKIKGLLKGREEQVKGGIETVSNKVEKAVGTKHAAKVDGLSDKAKGAVDKLGTPTSAAVPPVSPTPPPDPERQVPPTI